MGLVCKAIASQGSCVRRLSRWAAVAYLSMNARAALAQSTSKHFSGEMNVLSSSNPRSCRIAAMEWSSTVSVLEIGELDCDAESKEPGPDEMIVGTVGSVLAGQSEGEGTSD